MKHIVTTIKSIPWIKLEPFCNYSDLSRTTFLGSIKYEQSGKCIADTQLKALQKSINFYHDIGVTFLEGEKLSVSKISTYVNYEKLAKSKEKKTLKSEITSLDHLEFYVQNKLKTTQNKSITDLLDDEDAQISPTSQSHPQPGATHDEQKKIEPVSNLSPTNEIRHTPQPPKPSPIKKTLEERISDFLNRPINLLNT